MKECQINPNCTLPDGHKEPHHVKASKKLIDLMERLDMLDNLINDLDYPDKMTETERQKSIEKFKSLTDAELKEEWNLRFS